MWIARQITARTFVWLAAVTMPLQGLSSAACGCAGGVPSFGETEQLNAAGQLQNCCDRSRFASRATPARCCGETSSPQQNHPACGSEHGCSAQGTSCSSSDTSVASGEAECSCGADCQCGMSCQCSRSDAPAEPATPPVTNSSPERTVTDLAAAASFATFYLSSSTRQHADVYAGTDTLTARDRCATLCRFTL